MRRLTIILTIVASVLFVQSCEMVSDFIHDGEVVAKVGRYKLYRSDLDGLIPDGVSAEDSIAIAQQYINTWASDYVCLNTALQTLSKNDKNLTKELEQYRSALLRYRYEQAYISEHLDTTVTEEQIQEYYDSHKESLKLSYPIAKARYIRILPNTTPVDKIRKAIVFTTDEGKEEFSNIAYACSDRYNDFGGKWIEITVLAKEFSTDYGTLLSQMKNSFVQTEESDGKVCLAYVSDYMKSGSVPPVEFCRDKIQNVIISARKQSLLVDLERDLLNEARETGTFEIY